MSAPNISPEGFPTLTSLNTPQPDSVSLGTLIRPTSVVNSQSHGFPQGNPANKAEPELYIGTLPNQEFQPLSLSQQTSDDIKNTQLLKPTILSPLTVNDDLVRSLVPRTPPKVYDVEPKILPMNTEQDQSIMAELFSVLAQVENIDPINENASYNKVQFSVETSIKSAKQSPLKQSPQQTAYSGYTSYTPYASVMGQWTSPEHKMEESVVIESSRLTRRSPNPYKMKELSDLAKKVNINPTGKSIYELRELLVPHAI